MRRTTIPFALVLCLALLPGCREQVAEPELDMQALRQAVSRKTEQIYLIHLKLDTAASDITSAELKANSADCSAAEYHAADAYRNVEQADEALLQLGRDLQELFNLDVATANRE